MKRNIYHVKIRLGQREHGRTVVGCVLRAGGGRGEIVIFYSNINYSILLHYYYILSNHHQYTILFARFICNG